MKHFTSSLLGFGLCLSNFATANTSTEQLDAYLRHPALTLTQDGESCLQYLAHGGGISKEDITGGAIVTGGIAGITIVASILSAPTVFLPIIYSVMGGPATFVYGKATAGLHSTRRYRQNVATWLEASYAYLELRPSAKPKSESVAALRTFLDHKLKKRFPSTHSSLYKVASEFVLLNESGSLCPVTLFKHGTFVQDWIGNLYPSVNWKQSSAALATAIEKGTGKTSEVLEFRAGAVQQSKLLIETAKLTQQSSVDWEKRTTH